MPENQTEYVTDTMALVLWIEKRKLPVKISGIFDAATGKTNSNIIWIPAITLAEIGYLYEKKRIEASPDEVHEILRSFGNLRLADLTEDIVRKSFEITDIPELHDRLIAGTAFAFNCQLLTNDPKIENSVFVNTIWN